MAGPVGAPVLVSVPFLIAVGLRISQKRSYYFRMAVLLAIWTVGFLITPFSDHNKPTVHNHTIRMALPAVLLALIICSGVVATWVGDSFRRARILVWVASGAALVNLFWFDVVCVFAKPENAWAAFAPIAQTFDL